MSEREYERAVREEITATLERAEFECLGPTDLRVEITETFERRLGECRREDDGSDTTYVIRLARRLFTDRQDEQWRDTTRHELAHAFVLEYFGEGVSPHGKEWMEAARRAGADPSARYEGEDAISNPNYVLACPDGCFERPYLQRSKRIKTPWKYACGQCETPLVSYDAGNRPTNLEQGTCYVRSIPWETREETDQNDSERTPRYILACPNGCAEWPYQRRAKRIKNPWQYTCPSCETKLFSCDGDNRPTDIEPGACHVASIPWDGPRITHACPNGCFSVGYATHSDETRDPAGYRCQNCDAQTVAYPAGDRPETVEPGVSYLE